MLKNTIIPDLGEAIINTATDEYILGTILPTGTVFIIENQEEIIRAENYESHKEYRKAVKARHKALVIETREAGYATKI